MGRIQAAQEPGSGFQEKIHIRSEQKGAGNELTRRNDHPSSPGLMAGIDGFLYGRGIDRGSIILCTERRDPVILTGLPAVVQYHQGQADYKQGTG
jgi:hypothetical protein